MSGLGVYSRVSEGESRSVQVAPPLCAGQLVHVIHSWCGLCHRFHLPCVNPLNWTGVQVTLHQGAIETIFLDSMRDHRIELERSMQPVDIQMSEDVDELSSPSSYPVKVGANRLPISL